MFTLVSSTFEHARLIEGFAPNEWPNKGEATQQQNVNGGMNQRHLLLG